MYTGPEVSGSRPVLVTFEVFKDREEVCAKSSFLKTKYFASLLIELFKDLEEVCSESLFLNLALCSNIGSLSSSSGVEKGESAEGKQHPHQ